MNYKLIRRFLVTWVLIIPLAIINGSIRNFLYQPITGPLLAHQISCFTASGAILALYNFRLKEQVKQLPDHRLILIGIAGVALTILFEFGFGHYIAGNSWEKLLHDYNILAGRLWILVLLTTLLAPLTIKKLSSRKSTTK